MKPAQMKENKSDYLFFFLFRRQQRTIATMVTSYCLTSLCVIFQIVTNGGMNYVHSRFTVMSPVEIASQVCTRQRATCTWYKPVTVFFFLEITGTLLDHQKGHLNKHGFLDQQTTCHLLLSPVVHMAWTNHSGSSNCFHMYTEENRGMGEPNSS